MKLCERILMEKEKAYICYKCTRAVDKVEILIEKAKVKRNEIIKQIRRLIEAESLSRSVFFKPSLA